MTMHLEIVRTAEDQPWHGRIVSDAGNTEPQWATEPYKQKRSAEKACVRLAEMFGWRDLVVLWGSDRKTGRLVTSAVGDFAASGVTVARVELVDERAA